MDKIDKEIISIIWDYMNKTLSEWCLIDTWAKDLQKVTEKIKVYWLFEIILDNKQKLTSYKKIIGHYDITAVLKYITDYAKNYHITIDEIQWGDIWVDDYWNRYNYQIWEMPNKPLHLYTQEEKQNLLDLLLKLK